MNSSLCAEGQWGKGGVSLHYSGVEGRGGQVRLGRERPQFSCCVVSPCERPVSAVTAPYEAKDGGGERRNDGGTGEPSDGRESLRERE